MNNLSVTVKMLRKQYDLTQEELSLKSGVGLRFVRDLEQGTAPTRFYYSDAAHTAFQRRARCHDRTQRRACGTHRIFPTVSAATG